MAIESVLIAQSDGVLRSSNELEPAARDSSWAQLDAARLLLACLVVFGHAVQIFLTSTKSVPVRFSEVTGTIAWDAVLCFFVISGLVIGRSLLQKSKRSPDSLFIQFFVRRIARIYPPLLVSVAGVWMLAAVIRLLGLYEYHGFAEIPARDSFEYDLRSALVALLTFGFRGGLTGILNGPLWSLTLEMRLYVVLGLAAQAYLARTGLVRIVAVAPLIYALKLCLADLNVDYVFCYSAFFLGVILNFVPLRIRRIAILPVFSTEFSYSLYILHFPILLFIFYLLMSGPKMSQAEIVGIAIFSTVIASLTSLASGAYLERPSTINAVSFAIQGALKSLVSCLPFFGRPK